MPYTTAVVILQCVVVFESLIIIAGNLFTVFVFWKHRNRLKRTSYLVINLTVVDLLVGFTQLSVICTSLIPRQILANSIINKSIATSLQAAFTFASLFSASAHFFGTCICFALATPSSSSKHQRLHLQCHFCVDGWNVCRWIDPTGGIQDLGSPSLGGYTIFYCSGV